MDTYNVQISVIRISGHQSQRPACQYVTPTILAQIDVQARSQLMPLWSCPVLRSRQCRPECIRGRMKPELSKHMKQSRRLPHAAMVDVSCHTNIFVGTHHAMQLAKRLHRAQLENWKEQA